MSRIDKDPSSALRLSTSHTFMLCPTIHWQYGGSWTEIEQYSFSHTVREKKEDAELWFQIKQSKVMPFVVLPPLTVAEWIKRSRVPTQTQAGIPCSHERTISSQFFPASLPFVLSPSLPHSSLPWLFFFLAAAVPGCVACAQERCVAPCVPPGSLSRTLYVGRWPFPGASRNPTGSIDWWNLAGALL